MKRTAIKGGAVNMISSMFDAHMKHCNKEIELDPELVILYDLESGFPYTATKEHQQALIKLWEDCKPKGEYKSIGKIICFGTGGNMDRDNNFEKLFRNGE